MSDLVGLKKLLDQLDAVSDNAQDVLLKSMKRAAGFVRVYRLKQGICGAGFTAVRRKQKQV